MMTQETLREAVAAIAKDRADWLLDAVATATQDRRFLRGEPEYDELAGEAILLNGEKAIRIACEKTIAEVLERMRTPSEGMIHAAKTINYDTSTTESIIPEMFQAMLAAFQQENSDEQG